MDGSNLVWDTTSEGNDPGWDAFLERSPYGHHEQTSRWGKVKAHYGWHPVRLKALRQGECVAGVQVLVRKVGKLGRVGYICKGPVFDLEDARLRSETVRQLHRWAARQRLLYLVVELPYQGHALSEDLDGLGYRPHPERLPPSGLMSATLVWDLADDAEMLFSRMNQSKRQRVRRSLKSGFVFREGRFEEVPVFRSMMLQICARHSSAPTPPQPDFFEKLWLAFEGTGWMRLFFVEHEGKPVHAMIAFPFGEWMRVWKVGWSGEMGSLNPDEFDFWQAARWAKEHGFRWFDFVWINREAAIRYRNGERPSPAWKPDGMTHAKLAWGGEAKVLPLPRSRFYHPALHALSRLGMDRVVRSRHLAYWVSRLHRY